MEMYLYEERVKKLKEKYDAMKKKSLTLAIVLGVVAISILAVVLSLYLRRSNQDDYFLLLVFSLTFVPLIYLCIIIVTISTRKYKFYFSEVNKVIVEILRDEGNLTINTKEKKEFVEDLRKTRVQDGDFVTLLNAFTFSGSEISGSLYNLILSRSNGKTSYETLKGIVVSFNVESDLNAQVRNDLFAPFKMKKYKDLSTKEARVYLPKKEEGKFDEVLVDCFYDLHSDFNSKSVGIDVKDGVCTIYINYMNNMIKIKSFDSKAIENYCRMYIEGIEEAIKIKEKLERIC